MNTSSSNPSCNLIALLDLPNNSIIGLDGQTIVLKTDDFVGIQNIPAPTHFHLVTVSASSNHDDCSRDRDISGVAGGVRVAFALYGEDPAQLVRRYDPRTEEVSADPIEVDDDDDATVRNLLRQVEAKQIAPSRVVDYEQLVGPSQRSQWENQTSYINQSNILLLRGISSGDKIVPGAYDPQDDSAAMTSTTSSAAATAAAAAPTPSYTRQVDGKSITYPPIPVIDTSLSLHTHRHGGTKRFLANLAPSCRTELFLAASQPSSSATSSASLGQILLDQVLEQHYQSSWRALLGDLQLSYCLFLYLQCLSSLEHWKDLVAMLALSTTAPPAAAAAAASGPAVTTMTTNDTRRSELHQALLHILPYQLSGMDADFLEDEDDAAGGNFLLPSLQRLHRNLVVLLARDDDDDDAGGGGGGVRDVTAARNLEHVLFAKFPRTFSQLAVTIQDITDETDRDDVGGGAAATGVEIGFDLDEDGPVVVSADEVEASLARTAAAAAAAMAAGGGNPMSGDIIPDHVRSTYPFLVAAIMPSEDIVMTCARALDEKNDVSLVREAAAYLEQVEQYRT